MTQETRYQAGLSDVLQSWVMTYVHCLNLRIATSSLTSSLTPFHDSHLQYRVLQFVVLSPPAEEIRQAVIVTIPPWLDPRTLFDLGLPCHLDKTQDAERRSRKIPK